HGHCDACDIDFELDFANSIELIFRVSPRVRDSEVKVYCIGGPYHAPHVVAQVRLDPGERFVLPLRLEEGDFRLRSAQVAGEQRLRVRYGCDLARADLELTAEGWVAAATVEL